VQYQQLYTWLHNHGRFEDIDCLDGTLWDRAVDVVDSQNDGFTEAKRQELVAAEALRLWKAEQPAGVK